MDREKIKKLLKLSLLNKHGASIMGICEDFDMTLPETYLNVGDFYDIRESCESLGLNHRQKECEYCFYLPDENISKNEGHKVFALSFSRKGKMIKFDVPIYMKQHLKEIPGLSDLVRTNMDKNLYGDIFDVKHYLVMHVVIGIMNFIKNKHNIK